MGRIQPEGFVRAAIAPCANFVHVGLLRGKTPKSEKARARNKYLREKLLKEGPAALSLSERAYLLRDAESMVALHRCLWQITDSNFGLQRKLEEERQKMSMKNSTVDAAVRSSSEEVYWQTI